MLQELHIENFAIIDEVNISFNKGFNVLTGETGAGKSILIDAVNMVLGEKFEKSYIKQGRDKSVLEALFVLSGNLDSRQYLKEFGIDYSSELIISRELYATGRSVSRINGRVVNLTMLRKVTKSLIDIHGQHEHQSLLEENKHIDLVDANGDKKFLDLKLEMKTYYDQWNLLKKEMKEYEIDEFEKARKIDLYKYQLEEINNANLEIGEEEQLAIDYKVLYHQAEVRDYLYKSMELLSGEEYGALNQLLEVSAQLKKASNYETEAEIWDDGIKNIVDQLQDIQYDIHRKISGLDVDDNTLNELDDRMSLINKIKRKYGKTIEEIFEYRDSIDKEYNLLIKSDEEVARIQEELNRIEIDMEKVSCELTIQRKYISEKLENAVAKNMKDLNMKEAEFKVDIAQRSDFSVNGLDDVTFKIKTNMGQAFMSLSKIASGGEMSRIMLAFKSILADLDGIPTLIFDEIDTGISGRTAQVVAEKISSISSKHQVLSITHLPQLAAMGDYHYYIYKKNCGGKVNVNIKELTDTGRIDEISRLISGVDVTETTRNHAKEMLTMSQSLKKKIKE